MRKLLLLPILLVAWPLASEERVPPPDAGEGACLECHGELAQGAVVHGAVEMGVCDSCHLATGGGHDFELAAAMATVCVECHDDPRDAEGHLHGPVAAGECLACHRPHRSPTAALLRAQPPELCWSCHGKVLNGPDLAHPIRSVEREIAGAATVHGAIEAGCDSCHPAHSAPREGLFNDSFPGGPYAVGHQGSYELCFACHDEEILDEAADGTGFRDGERNLHLLHVGRPKSRSCALCHSPHGGGDHLLRESVRFGTWEMPIAFEATALGGSCAPGCHERRNYRKLLDAPDAGAAGEAGPQR